MLHKMKISVFHWNTLFLKIYMHVEQFGSYNFCLLAGSSRDARRRRFASLAWLLPLLALCAFLRLPALAAKKTGRVDEAKAQALAALTQKIDASASAASECRIFACTPWRVGASLPSRPPEGEDAPSQAACACKSLIISKLYPKRYPGGYCQRGFPSRV